MKDVADMKHNVASEKLVQILCDKTQNNEGLFFRVQVAYYFAKVASMMRAQILTHDRGKLPINIYAINLASSGMGKGHSTNIIEEQVIKGFRESFLEETFLQQADKNLELLAEKRALRKAKDQDDAEVNTENELVRVEKEFELLGNLAFSFDSGTTAAVKQMRHKLLMANCGSMNMEIDEIGSNLLGNVDVLGAFLELFDVGKIKQKLTKNTAENVRGEEIDGRTPTNMMLFGTPAKLFNGGKVEDEFYSMLETGYARRCLFGFIPTTKKKKKLTPQEIYDASTDKSSEIILESLASDIEMLADSINFGKTLTMSKAVSLLIIEYKQNCEERAFELGEYNEIRKAEMEHRYFKALKLAGTYAFIEGSHRVTEDHFYSGIKVTEESGEAFDKMLSRDRPYVKLAKYIAVIKREVTHVDITEDLPFYKGSESAKRELLNYATSWGYRNNIIIKKKFENGIEFLSGESMQETDLENMIISYGTDYAYNYVSETPTWDELKVVMTAKGHHWNNHHLMGGHRTNSKCIAGFNMVIIDVDKDVSLEQVQLLMQKYKYITYTTKRHQAFDPDSGEQHGDRFRLVFPLSHTVKLDDDDFTEFMRNVYRWLPFSSDEQTCQRSRKWESNAGQFDSNEGKLLDALMFIPRTSKCEESRSVIDSQTSLSNVERWFVNNTGSGNRSNNLIRYAYMLVDSGMDIPTVQNNVLALNDKLPDKLDSHEVMSTIMISAMKRHAQKNP